MQNVDRYNTKNAHPWRSGFCDAVQGRECKSPWAGDGFAGMGRNRKYLEGYFEGQKAAARTVETRAPGQRAKRYE